MRPSKYYIAVHEGLEKCSSKQCGEADIAAAAVHSL